MVARVEMSPKAQEWEERREKRLRRVAAVEKFLAEHPVDPEDRIAEPMHPDCTVVVAVPVHDENGYIFRFLDSCAKQQGMRPEQFEVILIVNNSTEAAKNKTHEFSENQVLIKALQKIKANDQEAIEIDSERHRALFQRIRGMRVHVIDKSSEDRSFLDCNVGVARDYVGREAVRRFHEIGNDDGLIYWTDADSALQPRTLRIAKEQFDTEMIMEAAGGAGSFDFYFPEATQETLQMSAYLKYEQMTRRLLQLMEKSHQYAFYSSEAGSFAGGNMAARMDAFALAGGIPHVPGAEDTLFGLRVRQLGRVKRLTSRILTPYRISKRTARASGLGWTVAEAERAIQNKPVKALSFEYFAAVDAVHQALSRGDSYEDFVKSNARVAQALPQAAYEQALALATTAKQKNAEGAEADVHLYTHMKSVVQPELEKEFPREPIVKVVDDMERAVREFFGNDFDEEYYKKAFESEKMHIPVWENRVRREYQKFIGEPETVNIDFGELNDGQTKFLHAIFEQADDEAEATIMVGTYVYHPIFLGDRDLQDAYYRMLCLVELMYHVKNEKVVSK